MKLGNLRKQLGFTAVELMVVLIVAVGALSLGGNAVNTYLDNMSNQTAADHAKQVRDAAQKYIKDNYAAIQAVATATTPATITVAMLQSTNYLSASFTATNNFGQSYSVLVLEPTAGQLQSLIVTTGGETIPEMGIRRIAQLVGAQGGYVSSTNTAVATGSYGGWSTALPGNYGVSPGAGHLAMALFFADSGTVSDYLYRNSVSGHPELNTMNTPLIMASVQTSGAACTTTGSIARDSNGAVLSCQGGTWKGGSGGLTWKGTVANFASLPASGNSSGDAYRISGLSNHVFVWDAQNSVWQGLVVDSSGNLSLPGLIYTAGSNSSYGAITMQGSKNGWSGINFKDSSGSNAGTLMMSPSYSGFFNAADGAWRWYVDNSGNSYQPGNVEAGTLQVDTAVVEGSACSPDGKIAKSSSTSGLILSCQSGVWTGQGAGLGIGQTWKNVSGSRSAGVPYKNITGQPIAVSLNLGQGSSYSGGGMYVDGVLVNYCWSGFSEVPPDLVPRAF